MDKDREQLRELLAREDFSEIFDRADTLRRVHRGIPETWRGRERHRIRYRNDCVLS